MESAKIYMDLYDNSIDSLTVAIDAFIRGEQLPNYYKISIKEMFAAFELFFKELLNQEHEAFIYENIEDIGKEIDDRRSVKFDTLLKRLKLFANIEIEEKYMQTINRLRILRNMSVHSSFEFNKYNVADLIGKSVPLLIRLIREYYDKEITLESLIGEEYNNEYLKIERAIIGLNKEAKRKFEEDGANSIVNDYIKIKCIKCNSKYITNDGEYIKCYCCHSQFSITDFFQTLIEMEGEFESDEIHECPNCNEDTMFYYLPHHEFYCFNCRHSESHETCIDCLRVFPISQMNDITDYYDVKPPDIVEYLCERCKTEHELASLHEKY